MTEDKLSFEVYRKLAYFFENNIEVHFKDLDDIFYNGTIVDIRLKESTLILCENVRGTIPILLECINPNSICEFKEERK